jgi:methyl-accepting chemotaxis protein
MGSFQTKTARLQAFNVQSLRAKLYLSFGLIASMVVGAGFIGGAGFERDAQSLRSLDQVSLPIILPVMTAAMILEEKSAKFISEFGVLAGSESNSDRAESYAKLMAMMPEMDDQIFDIYDAIEDGGERKNDKATVESMMDVSAKLAANVSALNGQIVSRINNTDASERNAASKKIREITADSNKVNAELAALVTSYSQSTRGAITVEVDKALAGAKRGQTLLVLVALACLAVTGLILWWVVNRTLLRRISSLETSMRKIADGDLSTKIDIVGNDEITAMAQTLEVFKENAQQIEVMQAEQLETQKKASEERQAARVEMANECEDTVMKVVGQVASAASQLHATAETLSHSANSVGEQSTQVAQGAADATENVQTIASAIQEMSASIEEITSQVNNSASISREASGQVKETNKTVEQLKDSTDRIGEIINLISDIADQTNLLALNATIEAARAGEAGRGFAVVASEVKSLANQTASATAEIASQIDGIQGVSKEAADAMNSIGETIVTMTEISTTVVAAIEEQNSATNEIAESVQRAAQGTEEVSTGIGHVSAASAETGQAAEQVLGASNQLTGHAQELTDELNEFINSIRAG